LLAKSTIRFLLIAMISNVAIVHAGEPRRDALFHIERNKNANIVQYDAQVTEEGQLYSKDPIVAYWIRLANEGEIKELTWIQKKFAYGFTVKLGKDKTTAKLDMAADIGRSISVERNGEGYRAIADIDGTSSYIDRIFIHATGSGASTKVDYIELYGTAVKGQDEHYERFTP
jgi:hypothetical protein